jgi:hypothetical protein
MVGRMPEFVEFFAVLEHKTGQKANFSPLGTYGRPVD